MNGKEALTPREFLRIADFFATNGYRLGPKIGEGTYSKVRIAERSNNGEFLAVKIIDKRIAKKSCHKVFTKRTGNCSSCETSKCYMYVRNFASRRASVYYNGLR